MTASEGIRCARRPWPHDYRSGSLMDLEVLFRLGSNGILAASVTSADRPLLQAMLAPSSHTLIPCRMLALAFKKSKDQYPGPKFPAIRLGLSSTFRFRPAHLAMRAPSAWSVRSRIKGSLRFDRAACADVSDKTVALTSSEGNAACCAEIRIIVDRAECVPGYRDVSLFR